MSLRNHPLSVTAALSRFGQSVRFARADRGWTQIDLAARLGVSPVTLKKIEAGSPGTAFGTILELCGLLGLSPDPDSAANATADLQRAKPPRRVKAKRVRPELEV